MHQVIHATHDIRLHEADPPAPPTSPVDAL